MLSKENEIFALVIKGTVDIQGLVGVSKEQSQDALYVTWMVASPDNNEELCGRGNKRYLGVGGHLFAIAIMKSVEYGYGGAVFGINHFLVADQAAVRIVEEYTYEWSDDEL